MFSIKEYIPFLSTIGLLLIITLFLNNGLLSFWDIELSAIQGNDSLPLHKVLLKTSEVSEFGSRIWSGIAVLLTLGVLYFFGRKTLGNEIALVATVVLGTSLFVLVLGKLALSATLGLLFITLSGISYLNYWNTKSKVWLIGVAIGLIVGSLTNGISTPIILTGIGLVIAVYKKEFDVSFWLTVLLSSGFSLYVVYASDSSIFSSFSAQRFSLSSIHFVFIIIAFSPWLTFLFPAIYSAIQQAVKGQPLAIFMVSWLVFGWLIYEFTPNHSPAISILAYPAMAIFIGQQLVSYNRSKYTMPYFVKGMSIIALVGFLYFSIMLIINGWQVFGGDGLRRGIGVSLFLTGTSIAMVVGVLLKSQKMILWAGSISGIMLILLTWTRIIPAFDSERVVQFELSKIEGPSYHLLDPSNDSKSWDYYSTSLHKNLDIDATLDSLLKNQNATIVLDDYTLRDYKKYIESPIQLDSTKSYFAKTPRGFAGNYYRVNLKK